MNIMNEISNMIKTVQIDTLSPAGYNPRKLEDDAQENLKASLSTLGIIKAIVIRGSDKRILAGHQRTKTMKLLGITECPAFCLENVTVYDEVRFNQLHNFTEVEVSENQPLLKVNVPKGTVGFTLVQPKDLIMVNKGGEANKVIKLTELVNKYGQFANAVADSEGNIIISAIYAKTIKLLRMPLLVYVLPEGMAEKAEHYFSLKYGEFNYDHIERNTYIQSYAQPERHPEGADKHALSVLYETQVIPNVTKATRILDFGAGCKNYYEMLKGKGYDIDAIEFFYCGPKMLRSKILTEQVERDCKEICAHLEKYGRYDVVVCDHVINSVDSLEAEAAVLRTCSALCKPGGTIYWAGNTVYGATSSNQTENSKRKRGTFAFLDEDKFTANYMNGVWYFQHYHSMADICECNKKYIGNTFNVFDNGTLKDKDKEIKSGTFEVVAVNEIPASPSELLDAVRFEFTLPLPEGKRYDLDKYIIPVLEKLLK